MAALTAFSLGSNHSRRDRALLLAIATLAVILYAALFFVIFALIARSALSADLFLLRHHRGFHLIVTGEIAFLPLVVGCSVFAARRRAQLCQIRSAELRKRTYPLGLISD